jgi:peptidyl-dipeptidase A
MKKFVLLSLSSILALLIVSTSCKKNKNMDKEAENFIKKFESTFKPLMKELNLASWEAESTGKDEAYQKEEELSVKLAQMLSDAKDYSIIKKLYDQKDAISNDTLRRQVVLLFHLYQEHQIDTALQKKIIQLETAISKAFNTYRVKIKGKTLTDNEIEDILSTSTDNDELKAAWEGSKEIGPFIQKDLLTLVKLRNEAARKLGYNNYHEMSLMLSEQDPKEIEKIFNELDSLTREPFMHLKAHMDSVLAKRYKIKPEELRPWHYQNRFFQEAPKIYSLDLDKYYKGRDLVQLTKDFYASIGLDINNIIARSDLFEKPGKSQHAFCTNIDREGDVRVLCNVKDNYYWMNTLLHEYGHAVYEKYISPKLPFTLREPAHTFTTEAIAMLFGRLASNALWMKDMLHLSEEETKKIEHEAFLYSQLEQLVFSRWAQVMYRFEKALYENPDQDLNKLWWDLVEKYQMIKKPEGRSMPDWATKIHIATSPCYYHNYLLGELLASQLDEYIKTTILKLQPVSYVGKPEIGKYLVEKIFSVGAYYPWNEMIEKATGEKLTAKYYAKQWVHGL